jgi:hypothetical protein
LRARKLDAARREPDIPPPRASQPIRSTDRSICTRFPVSFPETCHERRPHIWVDAAEYNGRVEMHAQNIQPERQRFIQWHYAFVGHRIYAAFVSDLELHRAFKSS